jgi:hypothetical protein
MNVGDSVRKAIDDWEVGDVGFSMLHACNAVDGTASQSLPKLRGSNAQFTQLLRDNYAILGEMGAPGIDIVATRFPVKVERPKAAGGKPDIADVIYGIHRCSHGHGRALPNGFELINDARLDQLTHMGVEEGRVRLSDRIIFGLLAVAVLQPVNRSEVVPNGYYLSLSHQNFPINEWWGRAADFTALLNPNRTQVKLDFGEWMDITT